VPSLRGQLMPREGAGRLPALLLDQGSLPSRHHPREGEQDLRLGGKKPRMRRVVLLLLTGIMLCCLGILLSLPATAPDAPSAFAGADAGQVDGGANALSPDGSYPLTPAEEVQETERYPVNASLLTMLVLSLFFGASVLWMPKNDRRRGASCLWGVEDRRWFAVAYEGPSFLGVFRL
jgi:hypothetical protein